MWSSFFEEVGREIDGQVGLVDWILCAWQEMWSRLTVAPLEIWNTRSDR